MTTVLTGPAIEWPLWSCTMRVVVAEPFALHTAKRIVDSELAHVERAASRFREDSELRRLVPGRPTTVSLLLATLVRVALDAARDSGGLVDPTVGSRLSALGYDRDLDAVRRAATPRSLGNPFRGRVTVTTQPAPGWRTVQLDDDTRRLTVPDGVLLDLGATAKAWAADACAWAVHEVTGAPVLVSLGGDIATAGGGPSDVWTVLVQDRPDDAAALVTLPAGHALATSSTLSRQWQREGRAISHILDPRTGMPPAQLWRSVSVAAPTAVEANTWATAALADSPEAVRHLARRGHPARLLDRGGIPTFVGSWPAGAEVADARAHGGAA